MIKHSLGRYRRSGETIVEVLFSVAVLSAVISGVFAVANVSARRVQANQERYQALQYASNQVELLRTYLSSHDDSVMPDISFCMYIDASGAITLASNNLPDHYNTNCIKGPIPYSFNITKTSTGLPPDQDFTYTIMVAWPSVVSDKDRVYLVYGT